MCPMCIATAAVIAAKATSGGGLTALVAAKFRGRKKQAAQISKRVIKKENVDGHQ